METKKPWQSKTMVVNGVMGVLSFALLFWPGAEGAQSWIGAHAAEIGMGWSLLGMALRMVTKDSVSLGE